MSARAEKLHLPVLSLLGLAVIGLVSTTTAAFLRRWRRPLTLTMSDEWLSDRARIESHRGWE